MKWSWKLGTVAGIGLYVHGTFLLLVAWIGLADWLRGGATSAIAGVAFILALFACVVLHELGHALTAQHYGIRTRDITLLPIGGVSRLERIPDNPRQEVWVAFAGPAVNVVIAGALYVWLHLFATPHPLTVLSLTGGSFLERLMVVNVSLAVFNLLRPSPWTAGGCCGRSSLFAWITRGPPRWRRTSVRRWRSRSVWWGCSRIPSSSSSPSSSGSARRKRRAWCRCARRWPAFP